MKPPIPVGYAKAVQVGTFGPATWANVFYFAVVPGGSSSVIQTLTDIASVVENFYSQAGASNFASDWALDYVTVGYRDAVDSIARARIADALPGTAAGGYQDAQVCYLINWQSGDPRRGGKPRQYVCGVPDSKVADSARLTAAVQIAWNNALALFLADAASGAFSSHGTLCSLVEMSFRNGNAWRTTAEPMLVLQGLVNPVVATQRRRIDRVRPS